MQKLIPEMLYNEVHDEIKQDINNLIEYTSDTDEKFTMFIYKTHIFSETFYWRNLYINGLLHCQTGPKYSLYGGGLGCGNYIDIRYDIENKEYLVYLTTSGSDYTNTNPAFRSSIWLEIKKYINDFFIEQQK